MITLVLEQLHHQITIFLIQHQKLLLYQNQLIIKLFLLLALIALAILSDPICFLLTFILINLEIFKSLISLHFIMLVLRLRIFFIIYNFDGTTLHKSFFNSFLNLIPFNFYLDI